MDQRIKISILTSLYNCGDFLSSYLDHLEKIDHKDIIEVLLLHNSPNDHELSIIKNKLPNLTFAKHIIIAKRESLYKTWNRGINLAQGKYICIWNVDDIRLPYSIMEQALTLDKNPNADLCYGDFYYMYKYNNPTTDNLVFCPPFETHRSEFLRKHHIGCFPMWRKSCHKKFGYFDEQLFLVADFDFQIRVSLYGKLIKTEAKLGYYLEDDPRKLSSNYKIQSKERTLLQLRYGMFDQISWILALLVSNSYKINCTKYKDQLISIKTPRNFKFQRLPLLFLSIIKQPRYIAAYIKHYILNK